MKRGRKAIVPAFDGAVRRMAEAGKNCKEIAEFIGCGPTAVRNYVNQHQIVVSKGHRAECKCDTCLRSVACERNKEIVRFYMENNSLTATGQKFSITRERVRQILNQLGIKPRKHTAKVIIAFKKRKTPRLTSVEKLWLKVDQSAGPNACHPWTGPTVNGYGRVHFRGKATYPNRVAYHLSTNYEPQKGELVFAECDNKLCCNPKHLRLGTKSEIATRRDYDSWHEKLKAGQAAAKARRKLFSQNY